MENKNHVHFFNMDISVNIAHTSFRFETCILEIQMQGCMSQNSDIGPSFHFMKSRKCFPREERNKSVQKIADQ